MSGCRSRYPRLIDRSFVGGLSARQRRELRVHLDECPPCRERWDRLAAIERTLGGPTLRDHEIDDIGDAIVPPRSSMWRPVVWSTAALVAVTGIAMVLMWPHDERGETLTARGSADAMRTNRTPGVRLFCVARDRDHVMSAIAMASTGPTPELRCTMDADLQLAYSTPDREGLTMVAFGRRETSTLMYFPPAGEVDTMILRADRIDEIVESGTRLAVNHRPGRYSVIARFFDHRVSVADAIGGRATPVAELRAELDVRQGGLDDAP
jgi:hypothetical protein